MKKGGFGVEKERKKVEKVEKERKERIKQGGVSLVL